MIISSLDRSADAARSDAAQRRLPVMRAQDFTSELPADIDAIRSGRPVDAVRKVLFANKFMFRNGGSEAVMFDEMAWLRQRDLDIVDFSMRDPRNLPSRFDPYFVSGKSYRAGSRISKLRSVASLIRSKEAVDNIARLIRDERPDILHCHNIYHQLTPSIINTAVKLRTPVVLTLHDYKPICPVYTQLSNGTVCSSCNDGKFEALLQKRCADGSLGKSALLWAEARYHSLAGSYHNVSKFIAPSRFMRDAVARRFGDDKVVHIPNGIDASLIEPSKRDDGYILYLGRLSAEKGVATLLKAHAADRGAWRLIVAGTGPLLAELQASYPAAEFPGHLGGADLADVIRKASMVVVPSEWNENSPVSILEAMAYGKPVVASRIGGIPELVRHGQTGLLFTPKDHAQLGISIRALLTNAERRARLGAEARRMVEKHHSLEAHGAALLALYQSVASQFDRQSKAGL
jgi:glycosyltransferase involved in cell wall biosynthesis